MTARKLLHTHPALRDDIGDLVTRRPVPGPHIEHLDPFLFLNHHGPQTYPPNNGGLPFGPHPHRGFETVTFILAGSLAHNDSSGGESVIDAGGVQWMTAGKGLVHAELSPAKFLQSGGPLEILQLWVNLPAKLKMTTPRYTGVQRDALPAFDVDDADGTGGRVTITPVSGMWQLHKGPVETVTDIQLATITLRPGGHVELPIAAGRAVFCYVVAGDVIVGANRSAGEGGDGGRTGPEHHLLELDDGDTVSLSASATAKRPAVVLLGHGQPWNEPIVAHGPFVMNTEEEIFAAQRDYRAGRFG